MRPAWTDLRDSLPSRGAYESRTLEAVKYLVVHHTAVARDSTALEIADYHVQVLGWPGIGYHWLVHQDGAIELVGGLGTVRYNVASLNLQCMGICLPGDWTLREPLAAQLAATRQLLAWLKTVVPGAQVVGHRDIALAGHETSCPGDTFLSWASLLR